MANGKKSAKHDPVTYLADRVVFFKATCPDGHAALVTKVHGPHVADVVYWCPKSRSWQEAFSVPFGKPDADGDYFVNPEG
jgi:hypothetical protein